MKIRIRRALVLLILPLWGCEGQRPLVARATGNELTVSQVVGLLAGEQFPNQPQVVHTLAELWVDYTLLAEAAAKDSTFAHLDLNPMVRQQVEQDMVFALRDTVVQPDTAISDDEVRRRFAQEAPGTRVRARHILLGFPNQATEEQRAEVRRVAEELLRRIRAGESFEELASQHSQDRGSATQGGDLGWFGRDEMVRPFEEAAFAMEPGEVSDLVESPYGLHIIRVEEKETPVLDEVLPQFRAQIQQERFQAAESAFVASVDEGADLRMEEGSAALVRQLAENPTTALSGRARNRPLVHFRGGSFTVGELREFLQTRAPQFRLQLAGATDQVIEENFLRGLAQRELLIAEAERRGIRFSQERADSMSGELRKNLTDATRQLGLLHIEPQENESRSEAVARTIEQIIKEMVQGTRDVLPLGAFSFVLRENYEAQVYPTGVERVVQQIEELRGPEMPQEQPPQGLPPESGDPGMGGPPPALPPDTAQGAPPAGTNG